MTTKSNHSGSRGLPTLFERSLNQTQSLVKEAEAILARIGKNRATISTSRPSPSPDTPVAAGPQTISVMEPTPKGTRKTLERIKQIHRNANGLSDVEFERLSPIFESRGFVVNADVRALFDLPVNKASTRLRALVDADYLLNQGRGTASRYFRGPNWPTRPGASESEESEMPRIRIAMASDLDALARFTSSPDVVYFTSRSQGGGTAEAIASQLRSPPNLMMVAEDEESDIVGYVHTFIRRKASEPVTGFIRALVVAPDHISTVGSRLLNAARNVMADVQVSDIKFQAPPDDTRLRTLLESADFVITSVEMTFKTK